ncbi:MAG TPA: hypothetical protein VH092_11910 [Urbifossiella sp.]|jgi:hypothetical protein|nr:hypothetical protein [Urbifossiella sp.]
MDLFDCCVGLGVLCGVWMLSAFALMAGGAFLRVPPVNFGQALTMTALTALVVSPCVFAAEGILRECYGRTPPPEIRVGFSLLLGLASMAGTGWLYRQLLEGVTLRTGMVMAFLVSVIETMLLFGYFGMLLVTRQMLN